MAVIGHIGLGKIGMPIAENLAERGHQQIGYRRSAEAMAEFEKFGGKRAASPAEVAAGSDFVISALATEDQIQSAYHGAGGMMETLKEGQIVLELGTFPAEFKEKQRDALANKGAILIDGEISGTPGMVAARNCAVYMSGDEAACTKAAEIIKDFANASFYFGAFGSSIKVKLIANLLVTLHVTAAAEAMAVAKKSGIDPHQIVKAVVAGAGNSAQFAVRAPWMADDRFKPAQGSIDTLRHYQLPAHDLARELGVATPMHDRAMEIFEGALKEGLGDYDVAKMVDVIGAMKPAD